MTPEERKLRAERIALQKRHAGVSDLERKLGSLMDQHTMFTKWMAAGLTEGRIDFSADWPVEDYMIDLRDFSRWAKHVTEDMAAYRVKAAHQRCIVYNYSLFEPALCCAFTLLGMTIAVPPGDEDAPLILMHLMLDDQANSTSHAALFFFSNDGKMIVSMAPEHLWEAAKPQATTLATTALALQAYIADAKFEVVERQPKKPSVLEKAGFRHRKVSQPPAVVYRTIKAVRRIYIGEKNNTAKTSFAAPDHKVHVGGFWRKVQGVGRDADGKPILGKTWVRAHTRWNDKPDVVQRIVYVKEPLSREPLSKEEA